MFKRSDWTSDFLWLVALLLDGLSIYSLVNARAHHGTNLVWSPWTWYLPMMLLTPLVTAVHLSREVTKKTIAERSDVKSLKLSRSIALLLCAANGTILLCVVLLLSGRY
jgi:hypothetical protein